MIAIHALAAAALTGVIATSGAPASGAGISAQPVCGAGLQPGHAAALSPVTVANPGSAAESITLAVAPVPPGLRLAGRGYPVPPSWIRVGYPRLLWVGQHSVRLGPGASAALPVSVSVPAGARRGAYVAELAAVAGTSQAPGAALGAAAGTYLIFTVGERVPDWPPSLLGLGCWTAPGQPVGWQQWSGSTMPAPPPGWHWTAADGWAYTPPPGWFWSWADPMHPREVYQGGPAHPCADAAAYQGGTPPGGSRWIGGQYPDTSTTAGCAAWLRASADGTLGGEPAATVATVHGAPLAARDSSTPVSVALAVAVLLAAGLLGAWLTRRPRR